MKSLPVAIVTSVGDILKEEELGAIRPRGRRDGSRGGSQTAQSLHPSETLPGPELLVPWSEEDDAIPEPL